MSGMSVDLSLRRQADSLFHRKILGASLGALKRGAFYNMRCTSIFFIANMADIPSAITHIPNIFILDQTGRKLPIIMAALVQTCPNVFIIDFKNGGLSGGLTLHGATHAN